jgi:membrane protein implicated in regulation of membrane protease activity
VVQKDFEWRLECSLCLQAGDPVLVLNSQGRAVTVMSTVLPAGRQ